MTTVFKPGYLKQWLDLQAKLIELIPHEISITEPKLTAVLPSAQVLANVNDRRTVHKYSVIITLRHNTNIYTEVLFSVNDSAAQMPAVWESYNVMKAEEAELVLSRRLREYESPASVNNFTKPVYNDTV